MCRTQLLAYFPITAFNLPDQKLSDAFNDLQKRPLLLALQDVHSLGLLSFEDYRRALDNFRPPTQVLEQHQYDQLIVLLQTADFYLHLGYRLSVHDLPGMETPDRILLSTALGEIGIGFQESDRRLVWPGVSLQHCRLEELFSQLPRADPSVLAISPQLLEQQLLCLERISSRPGTWIISLTGNIVKQRQQHIHFNRMVTTLFEDQFLLIDLSVSQWPDKLLEVLITARSVCFLFCNPVPLSFWIYLTYYIKLRPLVSVIFLFEPELPQLDSGFLQLLRSANFPELTIDINGTRSSGYRPDYDPADGLNSPMLSSPVYYSPALIRQLNEAPSVWTDLPAVSWVPERYYTDTVMWFSQMCSNSEIAVRMLTSTKQETNQIWSDIQTVLEMQSGLLPGMRVMLRGDPMATPLSIVEIKDNGYYTLNSVEGIVVGNNFAPTELEQAYVFPLERLVHRHYDVLVYFSAQPINRETVYRLTAASYHKVVILSEVENLRDLLN